MLRQHTAQDLLIDIKRSDAAITALAPFADTEEVAERLFEALQAMAETPTVMGSDDWKAKLAAVAHYFRLARCDAEGNLNETADPVDRLLFSFLKDGVPDAFR